MIIDPRLRDVVRSEHGYMGRYKHLQMMCTEYRESDGQMWRHASVSLIGNKKQLPSFDDLVLLKKICIGEHLTAMQIFPPDGQYFHGRKDTQVLHLWSCLDGDIVPDFRKPTPWGTMEI